MAIAQNKYIWDLLHFSANSNLLLFTKVCCCTMAQQRYHNCLALKFFSRIVILHTVPVMCSSIRKSNYNCVWLREKIPKYGASRDSTSLLTFPNKAMSTTIYSSIPNNSFLIVKISLRKQRKLLILKLEKMCENAQKQDYIIRVGQGTYWTSECVNNTKFVACLRYKFHLLQGKDVF